MYLDEFDKAILALLEKDGRQRVNKIAESIGLSAPACHNRIVKLESFGFIKGYVALLDHKKVGLDVSSVIFINFATYSLDVQKGVISQLGDLEGVCEILHITGDHDLLVRVIVDSMSSLNRLVNEQIAEIKGIEKIQTSIILNVCKPMYDKVRRKSSLSSENLTF